ncbi:hypothetical protein XBKB1_3080002 [Xenorhabdus bovienii str. kraussei Becker Underwood]|uniref:Uncharacterized protein n=1 Tax=Xenorhabdus bovienii str. kraussei Becker Underwood TaxID=1398204 RepID=A0A077PY60_XENBV|nr:hypothetical protein XBKB1_3080002 [Xenorhabdus bovienii str. kraussei Becker Underwood]
MLEACSCNERSGYLLLFYSQEIAWKEHLATAEQMRLGLQDYVNTKCYKVKK